MPFKYIAPLPSFSRLVFKNRPQVKLCYFDTENLESCSLFDKVPDHTAYFDSAFKDAAHSAFCQEL